ncbi:MAG: DUF368 domain-containing protein [Actinomycetia bacterium]|nr:DUF368 domain-containing protein [Actinomycetes bacterium]
MPPTPSETLDAARRTGIAGALAQVVRGSIMGAVDLVPGVSGGTVALVLGIYRTLIDALHSGVTVIVRLLRGDLKGAWVAIKRVPWVWLVSLGIGILTVVFLGAGPLKHAIEHYPMQLAGLFFGLITAAVILCWRQLLEVNSAHFQVAALVAVVTFFALGISPTSSGTDVSAPLWGFFLGGAIAITAMILPGISGSFILLLIGLYAQVLSAVAERNLLIIAVFALGCATGLALSSTALRWLLYRHHDLVLAAMIGLMIGSFRILWPWPGGLESTEIGLPTADTWFLPVALGVAGLVAVLTLDAVAAKLRPADVETAAEVPAEDFPDSHITRD